MTEIEGMILKLLRYDADTGKVFWVPRPPTMFRSPSTADAWNAIYAGEETMRNLNQNGYLQGRVTGRTVKTHRAVWLLHYGSWPHFHIDHINGEKTDNRIVNLRDVPQSENNRNARVRRDNTSGISGVFFHKETGKWTAQTYENGRRVHLGLFRSKEEAAIAKVAKQAALGFHPNHGRQA